MATSFKFNFDDIPDNVVPEGEVEATITKVELKYGKASNKPYLNWEFTITEGDYEKSKLWMVTVFAEAALFRLKQVAESLGFEGIFEIEIDEDTSLVTYPELEDTAVTLKVHHEEYLGRKQARVTSILDYHTTHHLGDEDVEEDDDFDLLEDMPEEVAMETTEDALPKKKERAKRKA